jgi:outer membrane protein TolC
VADQIVVLKTSDQQYREQVAIYQNQKEQLKLTDIKTKNALSTQLDLLRSKDQTLMQKWTVYTMQYNRIAAALSLIRALGGGYCTNECTWME